MPALTPRNVFAPGRKPPKSEIIQLLEQIAGGTAGIGDFRGEWSSGTEYVGKDYVRYGDELWYAERDNVGVTPIEGDDWSLLLPAPASAIPSAANRSTLAGYVGSTLKAVQLLEAGREGLFTWNTGNLSKQVTIDPQQGVYVAPTSDITGASGAWVRQFDGAIDARWFGAKGDDSTDDTAALQAWVDFHDQNQWKANAAGTTPAGMKTASPYLYLPEGIFRINPTVGVRLWEGTEIRGAGVAASMIKAHNTSAGHLIYRPHNGTSSGNGHVRQVRISGIRGIVTGASQIIFDIQHAGRIHIYDVYGTTQDRIDEFNNAKQKYWPGTALFKIGVGTSAPNGYLSGSDVMELDHFTAYFLDYGVQGSAGANQKQPEYLHIHDFEISDCHQSIVLNASAGMMGHIHNGVVQRWGPDSTRADTSAAGSDGYGIDFVGNKYKLENLYFESNSTFAGVVVRSGTNNILDVASMNRYGTTTTIYSDGGTTTKLRTT